MSDKVWRMMFVGGDWDGREQLVPDVGGRPQGRFTAPFLDGVSLYLSSGIPGVRTPYVACNLVRPPEAGQEPQRGWVYAAPGVLTDWHKQGHVSPEVFDLMAVEAEEVP